MAILIRTNQHPDRPWSICTDGGYPLANVSAEELAQFATQAQGN